MPQEIHVRSDRQIGIGMGRREYRETSERERAPSVWLIQDILHVRDFKKQTAGSLTFGMLPVHRYVLPPLFPEERPALEIKGDGEDKRKRAPGALAQARTHERDGPD